MAISLTFALSGQVLCYLVAIGLFVAAAVLPTTRVNLTRLGFAFALAGFAIGKLA